MENQVPVLYIQIKQKKSLIQITKAQQATLKSLGLGQINSFVLKKPSLNLYGLINKVKQLVQIKYIF